ncbi:MAG: hypothetical protein AAGN46_17505, partial [Acidobacteriota bacterium]
MTRSRSIADWLLLPAALDPPAPRRGGPWRLEAELGDLVLWTAPPTPRWRGAPWRRLRGADGSVCGWLHGELAAPGIEPTPPSQPTSSPATRHQPTWPDPTT